jgi:uncharacterized membrane-anchored protein YitT (DUF2179 family)
MPWRTILTTARDYALLTAGAILVALSVDLFLVPNDVVSGGLVGVAQLLRTFAGTPVGAVALIANVPLLILGFRALGGFVFGVRTVYATVISAATRCSTRSTAACWMASASGSSSGRAAPPGGSTSSPGCSSCATACALAAPWSAPTC